MIYKNEIKFTEGVITLTGFLGSKEVFQFAKCLFVLISKKGYKDIELNFTHAYPVRESFMVPALAIIRDARLRGVQFELVHPANASAKSIFHNANWEYLIDDTKYMPSTYVGEGHLPASVYKNADEQTQAVDKIMSMILKSVQLNRKQLVALEWSINEITDNVLNHAQSELGGIVQASSVVVSGKQFVEFVVADAGMGIPRSLSEANGVRALERAIQEGVTRNPATNQGNGLFGTFRITTLSKGRFELHSIRATLLAESADKVRTMKQNVSLFPGTFVVGRIGCDDEKLLENALEFKGKVHRPGFDYIEKAYEGNGSEFIFSMKKECNSFGSREAGIGARTLIENLLNAEDDYSLLIDFADVTIVSSSFADEVFGRLFVMLGPVAFMSRISFRNVDSSVRAVIDRSISLRLSHVVS